MPYRTATTNFVIVYGGCASRGPEMTIAAYRGLAYIWDLLSVLIGGTWHWFMTMDPLNYTPHWAKSDWIKSLPTHLKENPQYPESLLLSVEKGTILTNTATTTAWDKQAVLKRIEMLGGAGQNNVVVVLVGHGEPATGGVAVDIVGRKPEMFTKEDLQTLPARCRRMLIVLANCHAAKMFEGGVPKNTVVINTIGGDDKEDHVGLMHFLFLVPHLLSEQAMKYQSKTVAQFAKTMREANQAAPNSTKTKKTLSQYGHFSWHAFYRGGFGPSNDMLFDLTSIQKPSNDPIVQYNTGEGILPITDYYY